MIMLIIVVLLFFLLMMVIAINLKKFMDSTVYRKIKDMDKVREKELTYGIVNKDFLEKLKEKDVRILSYDGLKLRGKLIYGDINRDKTVIISHGITSGIPASYKYAKPFIEKGWNVLMIYHRRHVESEGKFSTLGHYEKQDILKWIDFIKDDIKHNKVLGIHGESMGASTALLTANMTNDVDFIVADCGFSSFHELLQYKSEGKKAPKIVMKLLYSYVNLRAKFDIREVNPIDAIKNSGVPVLFIHGEDDKFVPTCMSRDMYLRTTGYKELFIVPKAKHATSITVDYEGYKERMMTFVERVLDMKNNDKKF